MREHQVDHPAAVAPPSSHGLAWWLERGELVEHGGGAAGVAAMLRTAPRHHMAAVVLTNAESGAALIEDLLEPWFGALAGVTPKTRLPTPARPGPTVGAGPYLGRWANRQHQLDITRDDLDRRFWLSVTPKGDSFEMARRAGTVATTRRHELRPLSEDTLVIVDASGDAIGSVMLLDLDGRGRARFLYFGGRAVPRTD